LLDASNRRASLLELTSVLSLTAFAILRIGRLLNSTLCTLRSISAAPTREGDHGCVCVLVGNHEGLSPNSPARRGFVSGSQEVRSSAYGIPSIRQLPMAHHKMGHGVSSCLALSAPIQQPLNYLLPSVPKLTVRAGHLRSAVANRPVATPWQAVLGRMAQAGVRAGRKCHAALAAARPRARLAE